MKREDTNSKLVKEANKKYPDAYFVLRYQRLATKSISYVNEKLDETSVYSDEGYGVHAFSKDGSMGFASTNVLEEGSIKQAFTRAVESMRESQNNNFEKVPGIKFFKKNIDRKVYPDWDKDISIKEINKGMKILIRDTQDLRKKHKGLDFEYYFGLRVDLRQVVRSDGTNVLYAYPYTILFITMTASKEGITQSSYLGERGKNLEIFEGRRYKKILKEVRKRTEVLIQQLDAPKVKPGSYKIILNDSLGGVFIHEAFGHCAEADHIKVKSPLAEKGKLLKGKKIAPEYIDVYEKNIKFAFGYTPYDSYGEKRLKTYIVKDGKINDFLSDPGNYLRKPRGFSRAQNYSNIPYPRMSNTVLSVKKEKTFDFSFDPVVDDPDDIYKHLLKKKVIYPNEKVIFMTTSYGGQVSTEEGTFQFRALTAYEFYKSKTKLLQGVSFSGKTLEVLNSISSASRQPGKPRHGFCGKMGQHVTSREEAPRIIVLEKNKYIKIA